MTETTGLDVIRVMALSRVKRMQYGRLAAEAGVHAETLRAFAEGRLATLPPDKLAALVRELLEGHAVLDSQSGLLK
jgi:hypothetical protein